MALADILNKIASDTESEALQLEKKTDQEIAELEKQTQREIAQKQEQIDKDANEKIKLTKMKIDNLAQSKRKNIFLNQKRKLIERVYEEAKDKIANLPDSELEPLFSKAISHINAPSGEIIPAQKHLSLIQKALEKAGKSFKLAAGANFTGGFIFTSKEFDVDFTFDTIVDKVVAPKLELRLVELLFQS
jgi:V/A-type H+-transporting ATPase subunit E